MSDEEEEDKTNVSVRNFVASRVQEMAALSTQIANSGPDCMTSKRLAFQHVPKHMRRRAVSHNPKRLPKRLRTTHMAQVTKSNAGRIIKKPKVPSRKHRRRKSNLLDEYNRRQRNIKWMETHIWHAKRFHMKEKWSYKIPISPCDKGYRSLYRAFVTSAVMQDISFYSCLQLSAPRCLVQSIFKQNQLCPREANPFGSIGSFSNGEREGNIHFYKQNSYPFGYIGQVSFIWNPTGEILWLWAHPSFKEEIIEQLCLVFELDIDWLPNSNCNTVQKTTATLSVDEIKLKSKQLEKRPSWSNGNVKLIDLEGAFSRLRLYGPKCTAVLKEILHVPFVTSTVSDYWWKDFYSSSPNLLEVQRQMWNLLCSIDQVPCNSIIPLIVRDPRIFLPQKRSAVNYKSSIMEIDDDESSFEKCFDNFYKMNGNISPLWNLELRQRVVKEKMSDAEFNGERAQLLIPGSKVELGDKENQVPIMLVHRPPATSQSSLGAGWDLIIPAGWMMTFWIALSYRAVRASGIRDSTHFAFECHSLHSPEFLSFDSTAGKTEAQSESESLRETYFKLTPAKRPNVIKLRCPFPFFIEWSCLLDFWSNSDNKDIYILRDTHLLSSLISQSVLDLSFVKNSSECLVGIRVILESGGKPSLGAVICIPSESDIEHYKRQKLNRREHNEEFILITEPPHQDHRNIERDELRQKHRKLMAFMRKKRKKLRQKENELDNKKSHDTVNEETTNQYDSTNVSKYYNIQMDNLWLPNDGKDILHTLTRKPIGFITFGGECYSTGKCEGFGYCALVGLQELFKQNTNKKVLIRNCRDSDVYRLGRIEICQLS